MVLEWIVAFFSIITLILYRYYEIVLRDPHLLYYVRIKSVFVSYCFFHLIFFLIFRLREIKIHQGSRYLSWYDTYIKYKNNRLRPRQIFLDIRTLSSICIGFVAFVHLKNLIPLINSTYYDQIFFQTEHYFFGESISTFLAKNFSRDILEFLDLVYVSWYSYLGFFIIYFLASDKVTYFEYYRSFILVWFIGILIVYILPTIGYCFFDTDFKNHLLGLKSISLQEDLSKRALIFFENRNIKSGIYLISGFPSIHFAVTLLNSYYLYASRSIFFIPSVLFAILTMFATLALGWHYLLDDLGSILIVVLAIYFGQLLRRYESKMISG